MAYHSSISHSKIFAKERMADRCGLPCGSTTTAFPCQRRIVVTPGFRWRIFATRPSFSNLTINPWITEVLPAPSGPRITIFSLRFSLDCKAEMNYVSPSLQYSDFPRGRSLRALSFCRRKLEQHLGTADRLVGSKNPVYTAHSGRFMCAVVQQSDSGGVYEIRGIEKSRSLRHARTHRTVEMYR